MSKERKILFNIDAFKGYRLANNLTQKEYAEMLNTSPNVISYWETGMRTPLPKTVNKISRITSIPHNELYNINNSTLGTKLITLRLSKNIPQNEMADKIGTSPESINRWEADKHVPSAYFIYRLSKELGLTMEELITNDEGELIISDPHNTQGN